MKKALRKAVPFLISIVLLAILAGYAPWPKVEQAFDQLQAPTIFLLIGLSLVYYGLKTARFWYMLRALGIHTSAWPVTVSYISAQPMSLLPAGEIFRSTTLKKHAGVPFEDSLPTFTMQGLLEGAAMVVMGLISALAVGKLRIISALFSIVIIATFIGIQRGYMEPALRLLNAIPFVQINANKLRDFSKGNQAMLSLRVFPTLLAYSIASEVVGAGIAYATVVGLGAHITVFQAVLVYVVPLIAGFLSFLPGGFGVAEQLTIGILLLSHTGISIAVAATLLIRVTIVGTGVLYGGLMLMIVRIGEARQKMSAKRAG